MLFLWGCAHNGHVTPPKDEAVPPSASPVDVVPDDTASAGPPNDDDPFFAEEEDYWDNGNTGDEGLFEEEDPSMLKPETLVADPLMPFNRLMFKINDKLYFWVLKPVAKGYKAVAPTFFRKGVRNAFKNIGMPVRFVSSVLQGKIKGAGSELARFVVNTTVGVGGVWDPADKYMHLKPSKEDLGQTLGKYKIGNGCYIVWPFLGPSTIRDTVGTAGDMFLNPLYYVKPDDLGIALGAWELINGISFRIGDYEAVKRASMDPYVMIRDFYVQHRKKQIAE